MTTYNTGNKVGSAAAKDLFDNSENFDKAINDRESEIWVDRLGVERVSLFGAEKKNERLVEKFRIESEQALLAAGYAPAGTFQEGAEVVSRNGTVLWKLPDGDGDHYRWDGDLPKQVPAGSTPQSTGGVGKGAWVSVGDASLRCDLSKGDGSLIGIGTGTLSDALYFINPRQFLHSSPDHSTAFINAIEQLRIRKGLLVIDRDYHFTKTVEFPEGADIVVKGYGKPVITGDRGILLFGQHVDLKSLDISGIVFDGQFDRTGLTYPYYPNSAAPMGAKWAFVSNFTSNAKIKFHDNELRNFYELPFATLNNTNEVIFDNNILWKTKDPGFVNCEKVVCTNNKSFYGHDNGLSISRGNRNVLAYGNYLFSPAFLGIACYGYPVNGFEERGPDRFNVFSNTVLFSGQAGLSNVRGSTNGSVHDNQFYYSGIYLDVDAFEEVISIDNASVTFNVSSASRLSTGTKLAFLHKSGMCFHFASIVSISGNTVTINTPADRDYNECKCVLVQYNGSAQGYIASGTQAKEYAEGLKIHDNLFYGFARIGAQLGTNTGSMRDSSFTDNIIKKDKPIFDAAVIGIVIDDARNADYRTSNVDTKRNKIHLTGNANNVGIRYQPIDDSDLSYCDISDNEIIGVPNKDRVMQVPLRYRPSARQRGVNSIASSKNNTVGIGDYTFSAGIMSVSGTYIRVNSASAITVTEFNHELPHTLHPEFIIENSGGQDITISHHVSKIRTNTGGALVLKPYRTARFILASEGVYQQI
ncbi:hypothetical protein J6836_00835 [Providencia sp. R33]|uniref:tail fiber/spike domain-containing protein n=1 Tax=Providencia sp. R33 TaxID=2828763 RepID=UPI001C5BA5EB|nr:hypothetical protein [Providencia sp. R33]QXX82973.1 hypothetical protein J6836_00835 [Providencia sp. R33]